LIVVVAVALIVLSQTVWKADTNTPTPPTGEYQLS
jgi:hypothetical protein